MALRISSVLAILIGTLFLSTGQGLHQALVPIAGEALAFSHISLSLLASVYFGGYLAGCFLCPRIIKRNGHTRTLAIAASLLSALSLLHILMPNEIIWILIRVWVGVCFACIDLVMESWLADRAGDQDRGRLLAVYRLIDLFALGMGQFLIALAPPTAFTLFAVVAICISLAVIVVSASIAPTPAPPTNVKIRLGYVWKVSPLAMVSAGLQGVATGAYWGFAPVFATEVSDNAAMAGAVLASTLGGAAVAQYPVGWASDKYDRRYLIGIFSFIAAIASIVVFGVSFKLPEYVLPAMFVFGFSAFAVYPVAMTYAFDRAAPEDFVEVGAAVLVFYGAGAFIGPLLVPMLLLFGNYSGTFVMIALVYIGCSAFAFYRAYKGEPVDEEAKVGFVAVPTTTSVTLDLDPRVEKDSSDKS